MTTPKEREKCPECKGAGGWMIEYRDKDIFEKCESCEGSGYVER